MDHKGLISLWKHLEEVFPHIAISDPEVTLNANRDFFGFTRLGEDTSPWHFYRSSYSPQGVGRFVFHIPGIDAGFWKKVISPTLPPEVEWDFDSDDDSISCWFPLMEEEYIKFKILLNNRGCGLNMEFCYNGDVIFLHDDGSWQKLGKGEI